ncbi:hypothetical protein PHISCL_09957 [Aspergillus sclerotialis]|uniref:Uncharacterized protein n=1 Tax=Aspergillus sclerotialis TaxID=2070753 RepID=A0A3A2ZIJ8_9EURO|nr:hypothetical protein PHISCL_09957 [Aspergillus sclerotialis]
MVAAIPAPSQHAYIVPELAKAGGLARAITATAKAITATANTMYSWQDSYANPVQAAHSFKPFILAEESPIAMAYTLKSHGLMG